MKAEIENRIVRIALPTSDKKHYYFSGYILGPGILITCRHGFTDCPTGYDRDRPIKIVSQGINDKIDINSTDFSGLLQERIILYESEKYDIVLIEYKKEQCRFGAIDVNELDTPGDWFGGGYPFFNRQETETKGYKNFSGYHETPESAALQLTLRVSTLLDEMAHWKEASGSPIFSSVTGNLIGILKEYSTYTDDQGKVCIIENELKATYLKRLWDDPSELQFKQLIQQSHSLSHSIYRDKLETLLSDSSYQSLKDALIACLNTGSENILESILALDKQKLMSLSLDLRKNGENPHGLEQLLLWAMASHYENNDCFWQQPTSEKPYIDVPVVRVEACEFLMSAEDRRDPVFKKKIDKSLEKKEAVPGKYSITSPPEYGIASKADEDVMDHILSGQGGYEHIVERIFGDYRRAKNKTYKKEDKQRVVITLLERSEGTYYWLLQYPEKNDSQVKKIFEELSQIKVLKMADNVTIDMEEEDLFSELPEIIED